MRIDGIHIAPTADGVRITCAYCGSELTEKIDEYKGHIHECYPCSCRYGSSGGGEISLVRGKMTVNNDEKSVTFTAV